MTFKIFDRVYAVLLNICIVMLAIITPSLIIAGSPSYYRKQFEKMVIIQEKM